ncbi:sigma-70 family RNA polymerase sigma factor [Bordetella bronchialis]|uniref:RNA polymerase subunit sigma-70 n=1 Tax=Bordetella bronchialis TaxID=463025 RepID=A0A193FGC0_9BORD|nr:sigma-70 family RNA polymerase sigma factor [Bordetella bronchialis]ANN66680.1 RNA polymerase subunit sigma-70 [Bordetella bronchialis]ANN71759.1 RNA polymerase subunit sigma-70 [Bordetella bronchialis]
MQKETPAANTLAALYMVHQPKLLRTALRILGSAELADDVVQDTYLKLLEGPPLSTIREPVAYLFQTVRHLAIDYHRRRAFEYRLFAEEQDGENVMAADGADNVVISQQALSLASAALASLSARTRRAFELYRLEGHTQRDIARDLGVSTTLVNFMIRDAQLALSPCRECLLPD